MRNKTISREKRAIRKAITRGDYAEAEMRLRGLRYARARVQGADLADIHGPVLARGMRKVARESARQRAAAQSRDRKGRFR